MCVTRPGRSIDATAAPRQHHTDEDTEGERSGDEKESGIHEGYERAVAMRADERGE
jgi:hypothetical protein